MNTHATITIDIVSLPHCRKKPILYSRHCTLLHSHRYSTARIPVRSFAPFSTPSSSIAYSGRSSHRRSRSSTSPWCVCVSGTPRPLFMSGVARGRGSECAAPRRGEGECVLEGPRERCAEAWRGSFVRFVRHWASSSGTA